MPRQGLLFAGRAAEHRPQQAGQPLRILQRHTPLHQGQEQLMQPQGFAHADAEAFLPQAFQQLFEVLGPVAA